MGNPSTNHPKPMFQLSGVHYRSLCCVPWDLMTEYPGVLPTSTSGGFALQNEYESKGVPLSQRGIRVA